MNDFKVVDEITEVTNVSGHHFRGYDNSNVNVLYITSGCMKYFPLAVGKYFVNLRKIEVIGSPLTYIEQSNFHGLTVLQRIVITKTLLSNIAENTFDELVQLNTLILSYNQIHQLQEKTFEKLVNLQKVWLSGNLLEVLSPNLFGTNSKLEEIKLNSNRLKIIPSELLDSLEVLKTILFHDNFCVTENFPTDISLDQLKKKLFDKCSNETGIVKSSKLMEMIQNINTLHQNVTVSVEIIKTLEEKLRIAQSENQEAKSFKANFSEAFEKNQELESRLYAANQTIESLKEFIKGLKENCSKAEEKYNKILKRIEEKNLRCNDSAEISSESEPNTILIPTALSAIILVTTFLCITIYIIKVNRKAKVSRTNENETEIELNR